MSTPIRPQVGLGLLIVKDKQILLGMRKSSHGTGQYGGPGGHLELHESFEESLMREFREEVGEDMQIKNLRYMCTTNLTKYHPKHYVDIGMTAEYVSGDPVVMEPDKLASWDWYDIDDLPNELFGCMENYLESYKTGRSYFPN